MKKFYIIFFISFMVLSALLYISTWWFLAGVAIIVLITTYHFYSARFKAVIGSLDELELQVEELQSQLDRSLAKEQRTASEVMQIRQHKKELLTTVSHEIRTPMNAVLSMSLMLNDTMLTPEQQEYVNTIKSSGQTLVSAIDQILANDILEFSRLEGRNKTTELCDFNLRDSVEEVINMFALTAGKKGIELLADFDDNVILQLNGDNRRLRDILMNLIENAVKFTDRGQVLVHVTSLNKKDENPVIRFEVTDTGIGISAEQLNQLFYTVPTRGFEKHKKTNRGLIVCAKHAKQMGGKIEVSSSVGNGATFYFTVSFNHSQQRFLQAETPHILKSLEERNVLVIDDNRASRNIIIKQLRNWKMIAKGIHSATEALAILEKHNKYDAVLVDMNMPEMDGLQLARTVKRLYPDLPIVLLSNTGANELHKHDQPLFAGVLYKPLRQHILKDHLIGLFEHSSQETKNGQPKLVADFASAFPLKILVAEDNPVNQKIAIKILNKLGYDIQIANNGKEAIELIAKDNYDIILMDVQMPEMNGLEATKFIRSQIESQPIIIALTANVLQGDHDACIQAGMNDYMSKPIDLNDLTGKLEKWFSAINKKSA